MHIMVAGINHQTAPVELRERMAFSADEISEAVTRLQAQKGVLECVVLSTCNRMELYAVCDQLHTGAYYLRSFLADWFNIPFDDFIDHLYIKQQDEAVDHLMQVVCGLDSLVPGETQILGQVKSAFFTAQAEKTTGTLFNHLFKQAITFGKRVHAETEIGQNAVSVSYAAVELGKKMFTTFTNKTVLLVGAGKTGELTAQHLQANGAKQMIVLNRTLEKAQSLADRFQGEAGTLCELPMRLAQADIVISSTGASGTVITCEMVEPIIKTRSFPLFFIDIAVPRDIDAGVHQLENAYLYDIDDLKDIVESNVRLRRQEAEKVEAWIHDEVEQFLEWMGTLGVVPVISALRGKALTIQEEAMDRIERKLPDLSDYEKRLIRKQTKSIINQMIRDPITRIKESAADSKRDEYLDMFVHLFALEDEVEALQQQQMQSVKRCPTAVSFQAKWVSKDVSVRS
ncbi:glutamyl-tRNA reductase [Mechercharimyces sp. CAU 1602]|uniref:glutamyl-tRNA reductase n=1 Tax=Mechercharimyces sp. CAU 1602 TaxID=2973933 RepID=UPI0021633DC8|nr:glutamyl-tRNA reductase [Mechercharimyces sp. CAU 1602]MCS1351462.1 glutamyl-tRNA reductase [Mechercharimyces sp. CAU 1602]